MNLTPEQMNEAVEATLRGFTLYPSDTQQELRDSLRIALQEALPVLFAAWQEQTAAQAGKNPYPTTDAVYAVQHAAWARGAAGGVAASEQRVIDRLARETDGRVQRLRDAIHAADRELITIADFSIQEAADAIDSVRAGLKDALAETDRSAQRDGPSVLDQSLQAVINRLATDVGEPPAGIVKAVAGALLAQLPDARPGQVAIYGCDTDEDLADLLVRMAGVAASMVWAEGAACGVAAERERATAIVDEARDKTRSGEPYAAYVDALNEVRAALSSPAEPDPVTGGEPVTEGDVS